MCCVYITITQSHIIYGVVILSGRYSPVGHHMINISIKFLRTIALTIDMEMILSTFSSCISTSISSIVSRVHLTQDIF